MKISRLKVERIKQGLVQLDFWDQERVPQWRVSLIERGVRPTYDEAVKIAKVLGKNIAELFPSMEGGSNG